MLKILLNNRFIGLLILINTLVSILLVFDTPYGNILQIADYSITFIFLIEILYKVYYYKGNFFKSIINVMDMMLVLLASIPLLFLFLPNDSADLNYVLLLRVFKLFKFIRFGKFIPNFSKLI